MLIIAGPGGSGKTTLARYLEESGYGKKLVTDTTRSKREGEVDGVDYNFISTGTFYRLLMSGEYVEHADYYRIEEDGETRCVHYGSRRSAYQPDTIAVLTPSGVEALIRQRVRATVLYLDVPKEDRIKMSLKRGDREDEVLRRAEADDNDFKDFEQIADIVIRNAGYKLSVEEIAESIVKRR